MESWALMAAQASVAPAAALSFPALLRELEQEIPPEKQLVLQQIGARFKETPADRASVSVKAPPATEASSVCACGRVGSAPPELRRESSSDPPHRNPRAFPPAHTIAPPSTAGRARKQACQRVKSKRLREFSARAGLERERECARAPPVQLAPAVSERMCVER